MGVDCSIDRQITISNIEAEHEKENLNLQFQSLSSKSEIKSFLSIRSYKEYTFIMNILTSFIVEKLNFYLKLKPFSTNQSRIIDRIPFLYYRYVSTVPIDKLNKIMQSIHIRINSIYTTTYCFPRYELSKISYDLISRYLSYEESEDSEVKNITNKIIKRLNFFTEELPGKLKLIRRVLKSKRLYIFGYDCHYRTTFYLRPYYEDKRPIVKYKKPVSTDYVYFIFFIIEAFIPIFYEKFNFSKEINIYIDFEGKAIDSELIKIILHYFLTYYPLLLNRVCIDNYVLVDGNHDSHNENYILLDDPFGCVLFCDESFKNQVKKYFFPNCLPEQYGGFGIVDFKLLESIETVDDLVMYCFNQILIDEKDKNFYEKE